MTAPPRLVDRTALAQHRRRISETFLHMSVRDEVQERLSEVNRRFNDVAIVTPVPQVWRPHFPKARIVPDDETLDLAPGTADLVIHALALHWANDPVGQVIQCRRALRSDGLFLGASLGGQTLTELRACLAEAETRISGGLSPRVAPMGEIRDLGALLQRAGLALPVADSATLTVRYQSSLALMRDLRAMGETNALAARQKTIPPKALFPLAEAIYRDHFGGADGRIAASFEIVYLTGWAPDASQQKPLRPGSAAARLADALGTQEHPAGKTRD